ncbi:MAG: YggS family pyridoxal phosphate-dependent enzyme [Gemmataceae bacterium]|nr:YggS family pyridoxal phosphate-dependent enzyme [Gemmataceae bacterium]
MSAPVSTHSAAAAVAEVRARIARACGRAGRDPADVTLVAVTKTRPAADVVAAYHAGVRHFGENRVQEALPKMEAVAAALGPLPPGEAPTWRMVGHLQANKAKLAAQAFGAIDTVDSVRVAKALAAGVTSAAGSAPLPAMLEVNVSGEQTKAGVAPADVPALLAAVRAVPGLEVVGLMTVAPLVPDAEAVRPLFATLRRLAHAHGLLQLSMGMTGDFEAAIAEGATHVRIGRAIFGERQA